MRFIEIYVNKCLLNVFCISFVPNSITKLCKKKIGVINFTKDRFSVFQLPLIEICPNETNCWTNVDIQ